MHLPATENQKITRVLNAVAAGTSNQNTASVDMTGWDEVEFVALMGALTANQVTKLSAQHSSDDGSTDAYADVNVTGAMADADTNKINRCEITKVKKRYARAVVQRGTANAVIDGVLAIQRRAVHSKVPLAQSTTVSKTAAGPA